MTAPASGSCHPYRRSLIRWITSILAALALLIPAHASTSSGWPTSPAAQHFHFPSGWLLRSGVWCIHRNESVDWHRAWIDWRGARSDYAGGMQFTQRTWASAGGRGEPWQWSVREQVYRAYRRWRADGRRWSIEWGSAGICGLR